MENKDRRLFLQFFLTFLLLFSVVILFGEALSSYGLYLIFGLTAGFCCSWFFRNSEGNLTKIFTTLASLGVLIWLVYSLAKSSFSYQETLFIFVKTIIFLMIIFSFSGNLVSSLSSIHVLSFALFMCFPLFVKKQNQFHTAMMLVYFICWASILKLNFYDFFKRKEIADVGRPYPFFVLLLLLLIIVILSWFFLRSFLLERSREEGLLSEEGQVVKLKEDALEKEYYDLQESVQGKVSDLLLNFKNKTDRQEALYLLSSLINESAEAMEIRKAQAALIDILKRPGAGLEKREGEGVSILIKNYVNQKYVFSLTRLKKEIIDRIKKNPFNIGKKFSIFSRSNKIQYSNSYRQIEEYDREIREIIPGSAISSETKKELKGLLRQMKELRALQLYARQSESFIKEINSLDEKMKNGFTELYSQIDNIKKVSDIEAARDSIEKFKDSTGSKHSSLIKQAEDILYLRQEILLSEKLRESRDELKNLNLPKQTEAVLGEHLNEIRQAQDPQPFIKEVSRLSELAEANNVNLHEDKEGLSAAKADLFVKKNEDDIHRILNQGVIPDSGKELLSNLKRMQSGKEKEELTRRSEQLKKNVDNFLNKGFITQASRDRLIEEIEETKDTLVLKAKTRREAEFGKTEEEKAKPDLTEEQREETLSSQPVTETPELTKLLSIIISPMAWQLSMKDKLDFKAEGYFSDESRKDITTEVQWISSNPRVIRMEGARSYPLRIGSSAVYAQYPPIRSLNADIKVVISMGWVLSLVIRAVFFLVLALIALFIALYLITEKKKNELKAAALNAPRDFMLKLYDNAKNMPLIFSLKETPILAPLSFARYVEDRYGKGDNSFLRLTVKFQEAKYSRHAFESKDALLAIDNYNNFLKALFSRDNKFNYFLKHCLALLHRRPLFIHRP